MPTIATVDAAWAPSPAAFDDAEARRFDTTMFLGDGTANGVRGGIARHGDTSLAVAVNGSDQVTVQPGAFVIPAPTGLGVYRGALSAATAATAITARNATNPRIDLVAIHATGTAAEVKTIDGTPGASPSAPALPAQHIELARITVPAVGGGAVTVDSTWRTFAATLGGTLLVPTAARLPGSGNQTGQRATALDTGVEHRWDGTAWRSSAGPLGHVAIATLATSTNGDGGGTVLSCPVPAGLDGRRLRITVMAAIDAPTDGTGLQLTVARSTGGTVGVGRFLVSNQLNAAAYESHCLVVYDTTAPAAAFTYQLNSAAIGATGQTIVSGTTLAVEDIGKA